MPEIDVATTFATGATQMAVGDYLIQTKEYSGRPGRLCFACCPQRQTSASR